MTKNELKYMVQKRPYKLNKLTLSTKHCTTTRRTKSERKTRAAKIAPVLVQFLVLLLWAPASGSRHRTLKMFLVPDHLGPVSFYSLPSPPWPGLPSASNL